MRDYFAWVEADHLRGWRQTKGVDYGEEEEAVIEIKGQVSLV
jgi:hypothetical protein